MSEAAKLRHADKSGTDLHPIIGVLAVLLADWDRESRQRQRAARRQAPRRRPA